MKKKVLSLLLACFMTMSMTACGGDESANSNNPQTGSNEPAPVVTADPSEIVDGKFVETRKITVEVYDRGNDGGSDPINNMYTDYIKKGMLEDHNVEVEFVAVPRWTEVEQINNLLAASDAPDICLTYDYATIQSYANMGGVLDLAPYVEGNKELLPNLWAWLGDTNINWNKDPQTGVLWAIEGKRAVTARINTFVRKDWLDKLGIKEPTTKAEFESMLIAFRDNAELLLGADADKMIPYSVSYDVGWRAATLIESFMDPAITNKDYYINGFDDRKFTEDGTKEAVRLLNKWYNADLMWDDFALYGSGDTTEDDMMKAGYVGSFTHNWDYPFRNGTDSIAASLKRLVGEDAKYVAIDPFEDSKGTHTKFITSSAGDRKIFFPVTNDEPLASMLYLDWISDPEHIQYLQLGDEGVTHTKIEEGVFASKAATGAAIMNSGNNIDYTITCNGLCLASEESTLKSLAYSYAEVDPDDVSAAYKIAMTDSRAEKNVNVGAIEAEEGMGTILSEKRDIVFDTAVIASEADFDSVWDDGMSDYLSAGGQDIKDERAEKWNATYGDAVNLP
ncbi:MAG: extracellular solute-binding protein [Lachnospiraceae bacterium]|nr:extracellular solute-binding protein [Lachnospiraceae bacterium]